MALKRWEVPRKLAREAKSSLSGREHAPTGPEHAPTGPKHAPTDLKMYPNPPTTVGGVEPTIGTQTEKNERS